MGIGASAGGLEAFIEFLRVLPADTGLGFVLIQHLAPTHPSALAEILSRATPMPVTEVQDEPPVLPDHVYVIPPGQNMIIDNGALHLVTREGPGERRGIDLFFQSLAKDQTNQAIGVVLSGSGTDGTLGLEAIKAEGGLTFAQDDTAQQRSMPRNAIAAGCVDFVLPPDEIAREIARISQHPYLRPAATWDATAGAAALTRIVQLMHLTTGVDFSNYRPNTLYRRIARRVILHRLEGLGPYVQLLERNPAELVALHQDILIGVTSFFRDREAFEALETTVLPRLLENRRRDESLRIWVLGCSTGEEAYSLAMAVTEVVEATGRPAPAQVFATDLSGPAIEKARAGVYTEAATQDVSPARLRRFFVQIDGSYRIVQGIRDLCVFARHNVLTDPPFSRVDLISCRNLLIYLEPAIQQHVLSVLHYALKPRGVLWLGGAETIGSNQDLFQAEDPRNKIFAKRPGSARQALTRTAHLALPTPETEVGRRLEPLDRPETVYRGDPRKDAERVLVGRYAPPGVLVSADMEILQLWGDTGPYLTPAPGKASLNLLKMLRGGLLASVREAVLRVRTMRRPVRLEGLRVELHGVSPEVTVEVLPIDPVMRSDADGAVLILFENTSPVGPAALRAGPVPPSTDTEDRAPIVESLDTEVARLTRELDSTREYLQAVIEQQETANEELQSANEEVQSANEELQSINEELETSKEEIQSSNEELATVNDELNNRNADLVRANSDLTNVLGGIQMAIVILGHDLRIRRCTPMAETAFRLAPTDIGRPLRDLRLPAVPDLEAMVLESIDTTKMLEREIQDEGGRWHLLRIRPYRTLDNRLDGAVIVLLDIDALKRVHEYTEGVVATVRAPLLVLDAELRVRMVSAAFCDTFDLRESAVVGRLLYEIDSGHWNSAGLRRLLEEVLPSDQHIADFELEVELDRVGRKTLLFNARRLVAPSGASPSILLAVEDITTQRQLDEVARDHLAELAVSDRAKDEFLAMLAHELRNPLGAVATSLQLARHPGADAAVASHAWDVVDRQVKSLTRLVDDLLDVARIARGHFTVQKEVVDVAMIAKRAVDLIAPMATSRAQEIAMSLPAQPVLLEADPIRLEQVVSNLLNNASKFTPRGGHIWVAVETVDAQERRAAGTAIIRVRDDGVGIDSEMLPRVYDLFTQSEHSLARSQGGLGIGLTVVKRIVELHGGRVDARSGGPNRGSEFVIHLPRARQGDLRGGRPAPPPPERDTAGRRILVVDDSPDSANSLAILLHLSGHDVRVALDGPSALETAGAFVPEVVLLDIGLPGLNGYEVAERIRHLSGMAQAVLIAVTGYGHERDRILSRQSGFNEHLTKPVDHDELLRLLRRIAHGA